MNDNKNEKSDEGKNTISSKDINQFGTIYYEKEIPEGIEINSYDEAVRVCLKTLYPDKFKKL